jgi:hypothetical protein
MIETWSLQVDPLLGGLFHIQRIGSLRFSGRESALLVAVPGRQFSTPLTEIALTYDVMVMVASGNHAVVGLMNFGFRSVLPVFLFGLADLVFRCL